jgi:predicted Zn-dependent protease
MSIAMGVGIASTVAAVAVSSHDRSHQDVALTGLAAAAALAITLPNSRSAETAADRTGIELAARAGYDPRAAVTLWEKMSKEGNSPPEFLSTHPSPENRRERLQALAADLESVYRDARKRISGS